MKKSLSFSRIKSILRQKCGMTLVEMIVCFALLGIFLVAAVACVTPVLKTYYRIRSINEAQSISDALLQSIRAELQSAQGEFNEGEGNFIKLRDQYGVTVPLDSINGMSGGTVEFLCPVYDDELMEVSVFASQIDCSGVSAWSVFNSGIRFHKTNQSVDMSETERDFYDSRYDNMLIQRYYTTGTGNDGKYRDYYAGPFGDEAQLYDWQMLYPVGSYMGFTAEVSFEIPPQALESGKYVKYINVGIKIKDADTVKFEIVSSIELSNHPVYSSMATTTYDVVLAG